MAVEVACSNEEANATAWALSDELDAQPRGFRDLLRLQQALSEELVLAHERDLDVLREEVSRLRNSISPLPLLADWLPLDSNLPEDACHSGDWQDSPVSRRSAEVQTSPLPTTLPHSCQCREEEQQTSAASAVEKDAAVVEAKEAQDKQEPDERPKCNGVLPGAVECEARLELEMMLEDFEEEDIEAPVGTQVTGPAGHATAGGGPHERPTAPSPPEGGADEADDDRPFFKAVVSTHVSPPQVPGGTQGGGRRFTAFPKGPLQLEEEEDEDAAINKGVGLGHDRQLLRLNTDSDASESEMDPVPAASSHGASADAAWRALEGKPAPETRLSMQMMDGALLSAVKDLATKSGASGQQEEGEWRTGETFRLRRKVGGTQRGLQACDANGVPDSADLISPPPEMPEMEPPPKPEAAKVNKFKGAVSSLITSKRITAVCNAACSPKEEMEIEKKRLQSRSISRLQTTAFEDPSEANTFKVLEAWTESPFEVATKGRGSVRNSDGFNVFGMGHRHSDADQDDEMNWCSHWWDRTVGRLMQSPSSRKNVIWDLVGILLIGYDCVFVPMEVFSPDETLWSIFVSWFARFFWSFNMVLMFFTGYVYMDGTMEMRPARAASRYLRTWFPLDCFVVFFDWAEYLTQEALGLKNIGTALRGLRVARTLRLLRLMKAKELTKNIAEYFPFSDQLVMVIDILKIMVVFVWVTHLVACIWYLVGLIGHSAGYPSWIYNESGANGEGGDGDGIRHLGITYSYTVCFFWSMAAFSGEITSSLYNEGERVFASSVLFLAFVVSASYVGSITTSMTRLQILASESSSKLAVLRKFLQEHQINRALSLRVQRNAAAAMEMSKARAQESSVELLALVSSPVMVELHFDMHYRILEGHPFMEAYHEINPAGIRRVCHTAISELNLHTRDVLFTDLEVPSDPRMFFLMSGEMYYMQDRSVKTVEKGQWLSEGVLWTKWRHCGTARAKTETRLLVIDADNFAESISSFPSDHASNYAEEFVKYINSLGKARTDLGSSKDEVRCMIDLAFPQESDLEDESDEEEQAPAAPKANSNTAMLMKAAFLLKGAVKAEASSKAKLAHGGSVGSVGSGGGRRRSSKDMMSHSSSASSGRGASKLRSNGATAVVPASRS
eukprot:TRINITY_DN112384_c0_g1_i1.p1 TRINITY_DN112384_c0_g1~~TRINITY_DN112384_c0_g1_i1.p1  ORF type:complete len:1128 (+),score=285.19 TRINITY_DN112384_c0_g1_i1:86-3469(+)